MAGHLQHSVGEARMLRRSVATPYRRQISVAIVIVSASTRPKVINTCEIQLLKLSDALLYIGVNMERNGMKKLRAD